MATVKMDDLNLELQALDSPNAPINAIGLVLGQRSSQYEVFWASMSSR